MFIIFKNILDDFWGFYNDTNVSVSSPMATNTCHGTMVRTNVVDVYGLGLTFCVIFIRFIYIHVSVL
jgi:hypothetical protein